MRKVRIMKDEVGFRADEQAQEGIPLRDVG